MVATIALVLALLGSALSDVLLSPVVINGRRVQANNPFPVQSPPSPFPFRSSPPNVLVQPVSNFQAPPAFAPQPPLRTSQAAPVFAPQLSSSRFQSDFAAPQTSFAAQAQPSFVPSTNSIRIQNDFLPDPSQPGATVVRRVYQQDDSGAYSNEYETSDGQIFKEVGQPKVLPTGEVVIVKTGYYGYTTPEGIKFALGYVADEQGYRATSDNIPK